MSRSAIVNYHVAEGGPPTYEIDAGGAAGTLVSPSHAPTVVDVTDLRGLEASITYAEDGLCFARSPTVVTSFEHDDRWQPVYDEELRTLLRRHLGAQDVRVFDHTVRVDDPTAVRRPARNAHVDYSPRGARQRLNELLGATEAAQCERGHYAFVNVWRPIGSPVNSAPLGFVRPSTVASTDFIPIELVYPDRIGHILGLQSNGNHEWVYMSKMTPDEVVCFTVYDNRGRPSVGHSALDLVEDEHVHTIRRSIESRTLVRF